MATEYDLARVEARLLHIQDMAESIASRTDDGISEVEAQTIVEQTVTALELLDQ